MCLANYVISETCHCFHKNFVGRVRWEESLTRAAESCLEARVGLIWDEEFCLQIKLEQALEGSSDLINPLLIQRIW